MWMGKFRLCVEIIGIVYRIKWNNSIAAFWNFVSLNKMQLFLWQCICCLLACGDLRHVPLFQHTNLFIFLAWIEFEAFVWYMLKFYIACTLMVKQLGTLLAQCAWLANDTNRQNWNVWSIFFLVKCRYNRFRFGHKWL